MAASYYNSESRYDQFAKDKKERRDAVELLQLLLKAGADLNSADNAGVTPLHIAARTGHLETSQFLLDHGADPNQADTKRETPLVLAIATDFEGYPKMKALTANGANVDLSGPGGLTPLMLSSQKMSRGALMYLLREKADANRTDDAGRTALNLASASIGERAVDPRDYTAIIKALASGISSVDQRDETGMTPLMWVAISNISEALSPLLQRGADVNAHSTDGRTPLIGRRARMLQKQFRCC